MYKCKHCNKKLKYKHSLKYHIDNNVCNFKTKRTYECEICWCIFNHRSSLSRHRKKCGKIDKISDFKKNSNRNEAMGGGHNTIQYIYGNSDGKDDLSSICGNLGGNTVIIDNRQITNIYNSTNNNNVFNITNNITINNIGSEDIRYISKDAIMKLIERWADTPDVIFTKFIEMKNFDKEHPENHNFYMDNIKEKRIVVHHNDKKFIAKRDNVYQASISSTKKMINNYIENEGNKNEIKKYKQYANEIIDDMYKYNDGEYGSTKKSKNKYVYQRHSLDNLLTTKKKYENHPPGSLYDGDERVNDSLTDIKVKNTIMKSTPSTYRPTENGDIDFDNIFVDDSDTELESNMFVNMIKPDEDYYRNENKNKNKNASY